jgi:hypothetical protein
MVDDMQQAQEGMSSLSRVCSQRRVYWVLRSMFEINMIFKCLLCGVHLEQDTLALPRRPFSPTFDHTHVITRSESACFLTTFRPGTMVPAVDTPDESESAATAQCQSFTFGAQKRSSTPPPFDRGPKRRAAPVTSGGACEKYADQGANWVGTKHVAKIPLPSDSDPFEGHIDDEFDDTERQIAHESRSMSPFRGPWRFRGVSKPQSKR